MNRRTFITTTTAAALGLTGTVAADCHEEEQEQQAPESGEYETEDEVANRPAGENVFVFGDLEIAEAEVVEDPDGLYYYTVEGVVKNHSEDLYDSVTVAVRAYDDNGRMLDTHDTITLDVAGGSEWTFEISIREDKEDVAAIDIAVTGAQR